MELTERKKKILKAIVDDYIRTAEPVGSKVIAEQLGGSVSSATVRNEMADLADMGYIEQPHKSAGRVPSAKGYRIYVDDLMTEHKLSEDETGRLNSALRIKLKELDRVIYKAGQYISDFTRYPTYAIAAGKSNVMIQRFDILYVDKSSVIAVVMTSDQRVKSGIIHTRMPVECEQLPALATVLNEEFTNQGLSEMSQKLMSLSGHTPPALFVLLNDIVEYAESVVEAAQRRDVHTAGANMILNLPEYRDIDKANELIEYLSDEEAKLPTTDNGSPMKILIGPENVDKALKDTSVVVASYDIGDNMQGLIGVVGPQRMDYATVSARLSYFAEGMAKLFGNKELPDHGDKEDKET